MMPSSSPTPNFFIVGAPKAGTTSLYHYLDQHPDIYMSPLKEPSYFSLEVRPENFAPSLQAQARDNEEAVRRYLAGSMDQKRFSGIVRNWDGYLRLFAAARGQKAIGEASVCYLWSETAANAIASRLPHARIVIVLRDPADRAFSQYLHNVSDGLVSGSFRSHIDASIQLTEKAFSVLYPVLEVGLYAEQVQRYLNLFPREQIGIWVYEDTKHPVKFLSEVLRFLQVDPGIALDTSIRHLQPQLPRITGISQALRRNGIWTKLRNLTPAPLKPFVRNLAYRKTGSVKMSAQDRAFLIDYYKDDIHKLGNLLDRDLSNWLR
jgi:Sulfotransferase family